MVRENQRYNMAMLRTPPSEGRSKYESDKKNRNFISWPTFTLLSLPLCLECHKRP